MVGLNNGIYQGYETLQLEPEEMAKLYDGTSEIVLLENEYIKVCDTEGNLTDILKYQDKCFIYDGFYSTLHCDIECADDFLDRVLHQDSCKEKIAKAKIKKYIRPLEYQKYIRYLSVGLSIAALPIFLISIFFILEIISNNN